MSEMAFEAYGLTPDAVLPSWAQTPEFESFIRFANRAYHSDPLDLPASTSWEPRVLGNIDIAQETIGGLGVGGVVALVVSEIEVHDGDSWAYDLSRYGIADGRTIEVRVAPITNPRASDFGTPLRNTSVVWSGRTRRIEMTSGRRARILLGDLTSKLESPIQPTRYSGAGGLLGSEALKDRPLPICMGRVFNISPIYLGITDIGDGALHTFQSHWRGMVGHDVVRMRGVSQTSVATTPGVGQFRDWPALGIFQLGSTPDGTITADARGELDAYPNTTASILRRIMTSLGPQVLNDEFDEPSWMFAEYDLPGEIGVYIPAQDIRSRDVIQRILGGCGAIMSGDRSGKIRLFDPFAISTTIRFDIDETAILAEPEPVAMPDALSPTPREVLIEWGANNTQLSDVGLATPKEMRKRLEDAKQPVISYASSVIAQRVMLNKTLRLPGLYWSKFDAQARAEKIGSWLEGGGRIIKIVTDRYLGTINLGDIGRVTYPGYGLQNGMIATVVGMQEQVDRRRIALTLIGSGG